MKTAVHDKTGFQGYSFPALTQEERRCTLNRVAAMPLQQRACLQWHRKRGEILVRAERLVQYVHFGCFDGGALVLNTHFITKDARGHAVGWGQVNLYPPPKPQCLLIKITHILTIALPWPSAEPTTRVYPPSK